MKLNLRDLFWLIFVAAVATMWWIDRARLATELATYQVPPIPIKGAQGLSPAPTASNDPFGYLPAPVAEVDPFAVPPSSPPDPDPFDPFK